MKRSTPLRRTGRLKRKAPLRAENAERKRRLRAEQFGTRADAVRLLPCVICGASPCDPAHVKSRGAGGTRRDLVPLCRAHHDEQHRTGILSFQRKYAIDLAVQAMAIAARLDREGHE